METGLLNDAVKFQVKPYLSDSKVADEVLIEKIGRAANLELERQTKLKKAVTPKPLRLSEVQAVEHVCSTEQHLSSEMETQGQRKETLMKDITIGKDKKKQIQSKETDNDTAKAIEDLRVFRETMGATRSQFHPPVTPLRTERRSKGCRSCQEAQRGEECRHCYRCGQDGHLSRGCRQWRPASGNERGLLSWTPQ